MGYSRLPFLVLVLVAVLACGCTQPSPTPVTTVPATTVIIEPDPTTPVAESGPKQVNVTVWESEHAVIMQYNGGKDANTLVMFNVRINNRDGKVVTTPVYSPEVGKQYEFPYIGVVNANTINVVGVFSDGSEQTVLLYYF